MIQKEKLLADPLLVEFIEKEALPGTGLAANEFWRGFSDLIHELTPQNTKLLEKRDRLQEQIDQWHREHDWHAERDQYEQFLMDIGYLEQEVEEFQVETAAVDIEIAVKAGPQLVVPVNNARYAVNAANARWGSLYDALYGTDVISEENGAEKGKSYNPNRGQRVIAFAKEFLDEMIPLSKGSHAEAEQYFIQDGELMVQTASFYTVLQDPGLFAGYRGTPENPEAVLIQHHDLYSEIQIDRNHPIGATDAAGVKDVLLESAVTTIMDCEDSVTAVDAEDKVAVYRNWLGLMKGTLEASFEKNGRKMTRNLAQDRTVIKPDGESITLKGRSLLLIRNVGHLMTNSMLVDENGQEVYEGIADAVITTLIALHDRNEKELLPNSEKESIYIVKPKMHGSEEVAFANELFNRVEDLLGLGRYTIKIGVMDEERRTSLNLRNCIREVKNRIVFINTGFLDRTGDEIHTSMQAGPVIRKGEMKQSVWLQSYEKSNVDNGLQCGLQGRAQIGKGMWAMPDRMKEMMEQKSAHLLAGGNTAWVPSPTAATLHALHYHQIHVKSVQENLKEKISDRRAGLLTLPLARPEWSEEEIQQELENNAQGLLGYVVRWVEHGVGCSKVPDIYNVGLMEDRATLRISSQHIANWLEQGVCSRMQVLEVLEKMAEVVDQQNSDDPDYLPMAGRFDESVAFQAACELVFNGTSQPSGYTEPILHRKRLEFKRKSLLSTKN
ncbi:malate synthase G [Jeotgalibacillus sp. R-1-5s-1]|uniref:malate synthase G n=1 Tax=Jeotgalibacillus sp. R-1-5s-1 TaxID=2555897 RepID=UPI0010692368|nr:malate synthase G [Jeotgalibacillus sp. R-1-5s-1]TFE00015.1 malate synthase G [Jeotgalibacillus sp. R-1-5s-1]